jgi:hypothetical protein
MQPAAHRCCTSGLTPNSEGAMLRDETHNAMLNFDLCFIPLRTNRVSIIREQITPLWLTA